MSEIFRASMNLDEFPNNQPVNISRRGLLLASAGATFGALVIGFGLPVVARAQDAPATAAPGTRVPAFLEIRPDNTARLLSPFVEGGQGIFTAMAQIVGEELDLDPSSFVVENAPAGRDYQIIGGKMRLTGGSMSTRFSYDTMRHLGASARLMLLQASARRLSVPLSELTTEPGKVIHVASGRSLEYGEIAREALDLPIPPAQSVKLRDTGQFRWIGKPIKRLDVLDKSTGRAVYAIDCKVDGMLHAAVQHAPRLGMAVGAIRNEDAVRGMKGVHSVHRLPGAVAVVAERWWNAKRAVEALQVEWREANGVSAVQGGRIMPSDFSSVAFADRLANEPGEGREAEKAGDPAGVFASSKNTLASTYHSQYLNHAQLEPPSALARFNEDGSLDVWMPNQAPEVFQADIAKITGLDVSKINVRSPLLGGFFGRHFLYIAGNPHVQAIQLAKETGRPIKLIWSREEEFLRDTLRPMAAVRFRGALDDGGMPVAFEAVSICEGPTEGLRGHNPEKVDDTAVEGLTGKSYAIPNRRTAQIFVQNPTMLAFWRSVGNSMNDFFYECFLDELADKGGKDPYELRLHLLKDNPRLTTLLKAGADMSGGWKRGPFKADDGTRRARGIGMASPFGSHTVAIAEVSIKAGGVVVHDLWQAIDPGSVVNPAIVEAQINSAVALGLSQVLLEETVYEMGQPIARNYDLYPILGPERMPRVHTRIIESGEIMGGVGEPGLPAVPPAVANAVSVLTGQRIRSMPLSHYTFES
ncbi:xanthine dehydrogenase family protein molybdopterin-binding subunit [Agrobacterium tumefaciens]|uniref:xanthine dehydrogenase family protein molybdopterin-binding subunit n=1 Tax=Agrobacterium tumefaciens TaxID=358 RepID=UPI001573AC3B|nr:xanthine dehydrogenase family protein molybdopterin-binding subunit [Agrobacterium tumefaciens]NTB05409.1 xanthine dehydrogenase family protein molybdopterin-binding subunit [Agrobacterium tumefaciens]NTE53195.1 xanthine dehydrogenase family protein molybdopterin-binding subunit [Agrobacterium tumefaciens]